MERAAMAAHDATDGRSARRGEPFLNRIEDFRARQEGVVAQDHANAVSAMGQRQLEPELDEVLFLRARAPDDALRRLPSSAMR